MVKTSSGDRFPLAAKKAPPFVAEGGGADLNYTVLHSLESYCLFL